MQFSWIEPDVLAASGIPISVDDLESLRKQGIRAIVSLTEHPLTTLREITPEQFARLDIIYFHAPVIDQHPPDPTQAQHIVQFIDQMQAQGRAALIHCHAGSGRTGTLLHAYYLVHGLNLAEAKARVKKARPVSQFFMLSDIQRTFLEDFATLNQRKDG